MLSYLFNKSKSGLPPGSYVFTGKQKVSETTISVLNFNASSIEELSVSEPAELENFTKPGIVSWINICGLHNTEMLAEIGKVLKIHPLTVEDILNVEHNPKLEDYDDYLFIVSKMINLNKEKTEIEYEQVSFVLGRNYLITFQERDQDVFDVIRDRLKNNKGRIRKMGPDYLAYRLLDAIVDNYFGVLEFFDDRIENVEEKLLENPKPETLEVMYSLRKDIIKLRRAVSPLRDMIYSLERDRSPLFQKSTYVFLRDLYDHVKNSIETLENYREIINGMHEIYLSNSGHKLNEIVKLLTIISTIFIPLTFIAGIYGMNFNPEVSIFNMPELNWPFGYAAVLLVMFVIAAGLLIFFKRKEWL